MRIVIFVAILSLLISGTALAQGTRLLRHPDVSRDLVTFAYAGDLWTVPRAGGRARRLTSTPGVETEPHFSPDGSQIAFTATVGGNTDAYVISTNGGNPVRLTYHPALDRVRGWSSDGRSVMFASTRTSAPQEAYYQLWAIDRSGGLPERLAPPRAARGSYSPDGGRLAYEEITMQFVPAWEETSYWRHYRGGRTHPITLMDLSNASTTKLPWENSNDSHPMWVGDTVYFISDREHTANVFSYKPGSRTVSKLTDFDDFDVMSAGAGDDAVVFEQAGYIHLLDTKTGRSNRLRIDVSGDLPWTRPQFKNVAGMIRNGVLSPTGVRAAIEARGEIFTVPAEKGDFRNLTQSAGAHDRSPAWSPDGGTLAWLSDSTGEYRLVLSEPMGIEAPRSFALPTKGFFSEPVWSPDSKSILIQDNHRNLWTIDPSNGSASKIDTDKYPDPFRSFDASWSPDSKWIVYSKNLPSHLRAIYIYSVDQKKSFQVTDGLADSISPAFDAGGKYLYFLASTDYGPSTGWLEMSSVDRPVERSVYLAVLSAEEPSPLLPESDDEPKPKTGSDEDPKPAGDGAKTEEDKTIRVDTEGISNRVISIDLPSRNYRRLTAGPEGTFFFLEPGAQGPVATLNRYSLKDRKTTPFLAGITDYSVSADRKKLLYRIGPRMGIIGTAAPAKPGDGALNLSQLQMKVDPKAEWEAIYRETWRIQREFFYDEEMHGADWEAIYRKYLPLVAHAGHRADLGYIIAMVGGELTVGHSYLTGSGDVPQDDPISVGLLGADLAAENGRYRFKRIIDGENWNPGLSAPLSGPGIDVEEGDYILEVNGREIVPPANPYAAFEGTAGRQTIIRINDSPSKEGSRLVTVVPVASENALRTRAWVEDNRRLVDRLSNGRLAYVWLPNTGGGGYTYFTRYFYSQQEKQGAVIDERYNQGGMVADYIVNELDRKPMGFFALRDGDTVTSPFAGIYGPKVMLINESAGSGGDALPFYFRLRKVGPLIGTRTWGGLVGTLGFPPTIDGGGITAPNLAFYNLDGEWDVENVGVAPDIEVEYTPSEVMKGRDPQLERGVQEAIRLLREGGFERKPRPRPIDRVSPPPGK
ncbi:MAG: protease [Acidobacteria bacterium]|nr:MAG: protease [Acidobacteriota bacterium]REK03106.1 MAG: protease [Acidobacteriota bacterium]REK15454.1 MAG: protease [Acidobacteriota bacterium]REK45804.1 MAG: protease [Acidobacteriota bacterium]